MERIQLPVGRIVWGNPNKAQMKKDQHTKQPIMKDGKPVEQWVFGYAIPETQFGAVWAAMEKEAKTLFSQGFPSNFSWKYKDGTRGTDRTGKPLNAREGYNGHYVLTISTETQAPAVYKWDGRQYVQMQPGEYKTGDYYMATVDFVCNKPQNPAHTPGLYVNPQALLWVAYGQPIVGGADPEELFGATPPQFQLPPGASLTPIGPPPGAPGMPGMPPMGAPPAAPGYPPQQPGGYAAPAAPGYPPQAPQAPGYPPQQPGGYAAPAAPAPAYQPAYDFARPGGGAPGYPPQPAPGGPGYPPPAPGPAAPQYGAPQQPAPAAPGQFPGMPSPR